MNTHTKENCVETGERLLPGEIALLSDPGLGDLFYLKFAERI
jgi:hypothetical protein